MSAAQELDIVRDNERLRFPQNVEIKFVYWAHTIANIPKVAPHLVGADAITWEMAGIDTPEGLNQHQAGKRFEKAANHIVQGIATEDEVQYIDGYSRFSRKKVEMIAGLPKRPRIYLVDDYAGRTKDDDELSQSAFSHRLYEGDEYVRDMIAHDAGYMVEREDLTLRQLAVVANRLGKDGKPKQLAVLYGAGHRELSVAVRELGGNVTRVFTNEFYEDRVVNVVVKMMRYGVLPRFDDLEPSQVDTIMAAVAIDAAIGHNREQNADLQSAATVLRAVSRMDTGTRDRLREMSRDANGYSRRKQYSDKKLISKGGRLRTLRRLPSIMRSVSKGMKIEDEFVSAARACRPDLQDSQAR